MDDAEQLTRYLLGRLDEPAMAALEERYFRDKELFERLEAALDDLTDRYVRGTLPAGDRQSFELKYGTTEEGRSRIAFARTLGAWQPPGPAAAPGRVRLFLARVAGEIRRQPVALQLLASAALLIIVVGGPVTLSRSSRLVNEVSRLRGEVQQLASSAATERERREQLERQLGEVSTSSFDLLPGADRGGGTTLLVPRGAGFVRFQLALESVPSSAPLQVVILTADRATLWSKVVADSAPGGVVEAIVPAALFAPGEYQVRLTALGAGGQGEALATYGFRIVRR